MSGSAAPRSANDNSPLSPGQVKALKIAIVVMAVMIFAALAAIVIRLVTMPSKSRTETRPATAVTTQLAPEHAVNLPAGAKVRSVSLQGNRLLVHYATASGSAALVIDLGTGKTLSHVTFANE